jgi:nitrate/nitrite transport system ATP-binding protein
MRQRVAIARAFAASPQLLFLDEPFGALDALTRETVQQDLVRLCSSTERPVTTVMITNSVEEAILLSDRIVPMLSGPPATLGAPIPVLLPRPRSLAQLARDEEATQVRAHVVAMLTAALGGRRRRLRQAGNAATTAVALAAEERS